MRQDFGIKAQQATDNKQITTPKNENMRRKKPLLMLAFCSMLLHYGFAQNMNVRITTGNTNLYAVSDVKTITFAGSNMYVNKTNSTTYTTILGDIRKITFSNLNTSALASLPENDGIFNIYPNPAYCKFTVTIPGVTKQIKIFNAFGQLITSTNPKGQKSMEFELLTNGIYFIQLVADHKKITKKLIIIK
jgi:hypothetical protein